MVKIIQILTSRKCHTWVAPRDTFRLPILPAKQKHAAELHTPIVILTLSPTVSPPLYSPFSWDAEV